MYTKIKLLNFLKSNFLFFTFLTLLTIYLQYKNILSWGGYAGYVLQAKVALSRDFYNFIDSQSILYSYTEFQRDPVYTPIGLPILMNILSIFHNWNLILIKLIIPISLFLLFLLIIKHENIHDYKSLIFIPSKKISPS